MSVPDATLELGEYIHSKSGKRYNVIGVAKDSETLEPMVVYQALYEDLPGTLWVRPLPMFLEKVDIDGRQVPRFVRLTTPGVRES